MMEMKRVLYIGGFEMPDKNAAAQRVLSVAKVFRELGYEVVFYGITKGNDYEGEVDGFRYEAREYPLSTSEWVKYASGCGIFDYIKKVNPSHVILYNYPAVAQCKIIRYGRKHGIKVIGDITEWYDSQGLVKKIDTFLRMWWCNKRLDGIIAISKYLANYYSKQHTVLLPPLVDKDETKWACVNSEDNNKGCIELIYAGSPGNKDRLDFVIRGIEDLKENKFSLKIVGLTKEQFEKNYDCVVADEKMVNCHFYGRLPHQEVVKHLKQSDFQIFFRENTRVNNAGFPTKFVESISAGVPVITNRVSNVSDYVIDGENGFIVDDLTQENIVSVLTKVSLLDRREVNRIKKCCDDMMFDYRNFLEPIQEFLSVML